MTVYLVGAGPGDPGLITVRGAKVLGLADVVVYDRLAHPDLLDLAPGSAERISAAKAPGDVAMTQSAINALLIERGSRGQTVVRLKGGDPFVFGRGGEEAAALAAAGVPFEIVPGVTSALAAPAYAGIPATHRRLAHTVTIVTGHEDPTEPGSVNWDALAGLGGTLLVLMGASHAAGIARRLMDAGMAATTPVAVVHWGTHERQQTRRGVLGSLGAAPVASPSVLVIGDVAEMDLAWFGTALHEGAGGTTGSGCPVLGEILRADVPQGR